MTSINDVLAELEKIIEWSRQNESPAGYFASVYFLMTDAVKKAILDGAFENGSRMEQLDVRFAKRYVEAFYDWQQGRPVSRSWAAAFDAVSDTNLTALQHILLGINAHINLDLGIAAAQTRPGDAIFGLRKDFNKINDIIAALTDETQTRLARIWLPFGWLDQWLKTEDEGWINFSIGMARNTAWKAATVLAFTHETSAEKQVIDELDHIVETIASRIRRPGFWIQNVLYFLRRGEQGSVRERIELLIKQ